MISLHIVPVHQRGVEPSATVKRGYRTSSKAEAPAYLISISTLTNHVNGSRFFNALVDGTQNLEKLCYEMVSDYFEPDRCILQFDSMMQPDEDNGHLKIIYRLVHHELESKEGLVDAYALIEREHEESKITIDSLPNHSADYSMAFSVIENMHLQFVQTTETKLNKVGYQVLLSLLPEYFDAREIQLAYEAIAGKQTPSGHLLSNTLLKNYRLGYKDKKVTRPPVTGRDLVQKVAIEVPDGDDPDNYFIVEQSTLDDLLDAKRLEYKLLYPEYFKRGGNRVKTLFRKKVIS